MSKYESLLEKQNEDLIKELGEARNKLDLLEKAGASLEHFIVNWIYARENAPDPAELGGLQYINERNTLVINSGRITGHSTALMKVFLKFNESIILTPHRQSFITRMLNRKDTTFPSHRKSSIIQFPFLGTTRGEIAGRRISIILCDDFSQWTVPAFSQFREILEGAIERPIVVKVG